MAIYNLIIAEETRIEETVVIIMTNPRTFYNLALCLQRLERQEEVETAYLTALDIAKEDYSIMYALTILYIQQQRWEDANLSARHLLRSNPDSIEIKEIVEYIRQNRDE